jgi:hypothetical protein
MLSEESYQLAWLVYFGAAATSILCMHLWWFAWLGGRLRLTVALLLAALLLTPAHPGEDIQTWAPAIVVGGFDLLTHGPDAAMQAFKLIGLACLLALLPALVWSWIRQRRGRVPQAATEAAPQAAPEATPKGPQGA